MEQKGNSVRKRLPQIDLYEKMFTSNQATPTTSPAMDNYLPPSSVVKNESPKERGSLQSLMRNYGTQSNEVKHSAVDNYVAPGEMPTKEEEEDEEEDKEMLVGSPPSRFKPNDNDLYTYSSPTEEDYDAINVYQVNDDINNASAAETMKNLYYPPDEYFTKNEPYSTIEADHDTAPASYSVAEPQKASYPSYDINNNSKENDTYDDVKPVKPKKEESKPIVEDRKTDAELLTFFEGYRNVTPKSTSKWAQLKNKLFTRNWNKEFQQLLDMDDSKEKFVKLRNLEHDFVYAAETYGRIIISEHCLPDHQKTINPVSVGGVAGGEKYIVAGILFKFAIDGFGLYGSDENAMKASSHELHGMQGYYQLNIKGIHVPLMAFIDYRGWRLQAVSVLPISGSSLIYGSADGGRNVLKDNPQINSLMKEAGRLLNLKAHMVGPEHGLKEIDSCCDIEGHMGSDNKFYLLDFARVAPPEPPRVKGANLYRLLRLEFVRNYPKPLSPDAYSNMGRHDYRVHCDEVDEAYRYLIEQVIPHFASKNEDRTDYTYFLRDMHQNGINCRHLGLVRSHVKSDGYGILRIAIARLCKCHLKSLMREVTRQTGNPSDEHYRHVALSYLNTLIGTTSKSEEYWKLLTRELSVKFPLILRETEKESLFELIKKEGHLFPCIKLLLQMTAIQISEDALQELYVRGATFEFVQPDLITMDTKVSRLGIIDYADAMALYYEAIERTTNQTSKLRLLTLSRKRIETAMATMSTDFQVRAMLGKIINEMATCESNAADRSQLWKEAEAVLGQIIDDPMVDAGIRFNSLVILGKVLSNSLKNMMEGWKDRDLFVKSIAYFEKCSDMFPERYETLARLGKLLCLHYSVFNDDSTLERSVQVLEKCFELMEKLNKNDDKFLGSLYFTFAETLTKKMAQSPDQDLSVKAGQSYQMAFKLNANTLKKIEKQFVELSDFKLKRLFALSKLMEHSPNLKQVIQGIASRVESVNMAFGGTRWDTIKTEDCGYFAVFLSLCQNVKSIGAAALLEEMTTEQWKTALGSLSELEELVVWRSPGFNDECLTNMAKKWPKLKKLDVTACNTITDKGIGEFLEERGLGIKELILSNCNLITDTTVENLAKYALEIERLRLSQTNITDASLFILQKFPFLSHLSLQNITTGITVDGLKQCRFDSVQTVNFAGGLPANDIAPILTTVFPNLQISFTGFFFADYYLKSQNPAILKIRENTGHLKTYWVDFDGKNFYTATMTPAGLALKLTKGAELYHPFKNEESDGQCVHIRKMVQAMSAMVTVDIQQGPRFLVKAPVNTMTPAPLPVSFVIEFFNRKYEFSGLVSVQQSSFEGKIKDLNKQGTEVAKTAQKVSASTALVYGIWSVAPGANLTDITMIHFILVTVYHSK